MTRTTGIRGRARRPLPRVAAVLPFAVLLGVGGAAAQGNLDFGGGSFEAPQPRQERADPAKPGSGSAFEGSFGDGSFGNGAQQPQQPQPQRSKRRRRRPDRPASPSASRAARSATTAGCSRRHRRRRRRRGRRRAGSNSRRRPGRAGRQRPEQGQPPTGDGQAQEARIDPQIAVFETRDFGVQPTGQLRRGEFHAPTPTSMPGAQLITTEQLVQAMLAKQQMVVVDVLGADYTLPGAYAAPGMAAGGDFGDRVQQQTRQWLQQVTRGDDAMPVVVLCSDPMCWMSYNAGLRAVAAGYTRVYWYRGGHQAWEMAGLPTVPASF